MKKRIKKGFTLVELLVVIAILAILASVTVVGYSAFTQKAKDSVAQQELTQIHNYLYAEDINNDNITFTSNGLKIETLNDLDVNEDGNKENYATEADYIKALLANDFALEEGATLTASLEGDYVVSLTYVTADKGKATVSLK